MARSLRAHPGSRRHWQSAVHAALLDPRAQHRRRRGVRPAARAGGRDFSALGDRERPRAGERGHVHPAAQRPHCHPAANARRGATRSQCRDGRARRRLAPTHAATVPDRLLASPQLTAANPIAGRGRREDDTIRPFLVLEEPIMSRKAVLSLLLAGAVAIGATRLIRASDHKDSMLLAGDPAADIADVYTFRSPTNPANTVLAMTVSGFIPPSEASTTFFDPNVLYQWKIDNNGDAVEDLVIQAFVTGTGGHQVMHFRGPAAPFDIGSTTGVIEGPETATVAGRKTPTPLPPPRNGMTGFAGGRDEPFF